MKVILLQKVAGLGNADEIKEVAPGYAKNFLFPKHLAVQASAQAMNQADSRKKKVVKDAERDLKDQQKLAEAVDGLEVEIKAKINKENVLYAAVTAAKVADALKARSLMVEPEQILMKPIKNIGSFPVKLKFRHKLEAELMVSIVGEQK